MEQNQVPLKSVNHVGCLTKGVSSFITISLQLFLKKEMFQENSEKIQETPSVFIFFENVAVFEIM